MSYSEDVAKSLLLLSQSAKGLAEVTGEENQEAKDIAKDLITQNNSAVLQAKLSVFTNKLEKYGEAESSNATAVQEMIVRRTTAGDMGTSTVDKIKDTPLEERGSLGGLGIFSGATAGTIRRDFKNNLDAQEEAFVSTLPSYAATLSKANILGDDHHSIKKTKGELITLRDNMIKNIEAVEGVGMFNKEKGAVSKFASGVVGVFSENEEELISRANAYIKDIDSLLDLID